MKKRFLTFILTIATMLMCIFGFSACGGEDHTHAYTAQTTTEATCTEKGLITYTCDCGDSYTEEIPATGVHTWDDGKIITEPTCTEKGEKTFTCTVCETATKTEPIDKLPHEHNTEKWTSNAAYHWHKCECGDKKDEEKHTAGAPATATTPQTCTVCGYVLQVETGILFNTLTVDGAKVYGKVSNTTTEFSFIDEVTVKGNATYVVDNDKDCGSPIFSKTVDLKIGDNTFYVLEMIGNDVKLFTVTIRRRPMYEVTFNANGGTSVEKQVIEEDFLATEPETTRTGYTFTGWDYDFATPITQTTKITVSWEIINYTIAYDLNSGVLVDGQNPTSYTVETDITLHNPRKTNCAFLGWYHGNQKIEGIEKGSIGDLNLLAKWEDALVIADKTLTGVTELAKTTCYEIEVSSDVEEIRKGAFNGCTVLEKLTIPFVGGSIKSASDTYQYPFGYIFGTSSYTGGTATTQYYYGSSTSSTTSTTYYIPTSLKSVTITGGNILYGAFYNCRSLTSVVIPDSVTSIGSYAFSGCSRLTSIEIPDSVTSIGDYAFDYCDRLKSVYITDIAAWCNISFGNSSANPLCYAENLYLNDELVTELIILNTVTEIKSNAFYDCDSLTSVVIGNGVTSIGDAAFYDCDSLTEIVIPDSVTSIGEYAFRNCDSLTEIVIPDSVTSIGEGTFDNCSSLTSVVIGNGVTSIGGVAFRYCYKLVEVVNKSTHIMVTKGDLSNGWVGYYALAVYNSGDTFTSKLSNDNGYIIYTDGNEKILVGYNGTETDLVLPSYITKINRFAFYDCSSLTSVVIGGSVTSIGEGAFDNCSGLTSVTIGNGVTSIGESAFSSCYSLTSVVIGNGVTSIGESAFSGCSSLTSVVIGNGVTSIGDAAFYDCYKVVEVVNKSTHIMVTKGDLSNGWVGYYALAVYNSGDTFTSKLSNDNGYIIYTDGNEKILVGYNGMETDLVLPSYITKINQYAFYDCDSLTSVVIGNGVTSIGDDAFYDCDSLTEIVIPDSVTSIGDYAFYHCSSLTSVEIGDSVTSIGYAAFSSCNSLTSVVIGDGVRSIGESAFGSCTSLTSVVIGDGVTSISNYAFYYCSSLTEIVIPDSVTSIGDYAFYSCSSLTEIVIPDSVISIGSSAFYYCSSLTSVVIGDSVTSIGSFAFYNCRSLTSITFKDTSTWYRTKNYDDWDNKTGGRSTSVTTPSANATYFKSTYDDYYWYKL